MTVSNNVATYEFRNPYAAPGAPSVSAPHVPPYVRQQVRPLETAGRVARLLAALIDISLTVLVLGLIYAGAPDRGGVPVTSAGTSLMLVGLVGLLALGIYNLVRLAMHGQTIGKQLIGIRIVRSDGSNASLVRIVGLRVLLPGVVGLIPFIGNLFALFNVLWIFGEEKRCIHDLWADTIVVG